MAIEVMLVSDVKDLGTEGDIVRVSEGYARNYLFPRNLAAQVTDAARRKLAKMQREREVERKEAMANAEALAGKIRTASCTIAVKVGKDGKLYGSVSQVEIADNLKQQGIVVEKSSIQLDEHIKELGVFNVVVKLAGGIEAELKVWVVEE